MYDAPRRFVPGKGRIPSDYFLCGEAPGETENAIGSPFVGQSGDELNRYLRAGGLPRHLLYLTNLYKLWPPKLPNGKQLPPTKEEIRSHEEHLKLELQAVNPKIIIAVGAHAANYFLKGQYPDFTLHLGHGFPHPLNDGLLVLPVVHPAAGLHSDGEQVRIYHDFLQLGRAVRGTIPLHPPIDEYPEPVYRRIYDRMCGNMHCWAPIGQCDHDKDIEVHGADVVLRILAGKVNLAIDTEGSVRDPWCLTFSVTPGEAYLIRATETESLAALNRHINAPYGICTVGLHYATHDIPVLEALGVYVVKQRAFDLLPDHRQFLTPEQRIDADRIRREFYHYTVDLPGGFGVLTLRDTMSELYLLGNEPKGLKGSAYRLHGMRMESYQELIAETDHRIAKDYLQLLFNRFMCKTCYSSGKGPKRKVIDPDCADCAGSGRISGKRAGTTKFCACAKDTERCPDCVDGFALPLADPYWELDSSTGELCLKKPWSLGRQLKSKLLSKAANVGEDDSEDDELTKSEEESPEDEESVADYLKLRRQWEKLRPELRSPAELVVGAMPPTRLTDVPDQDRVTRYACRDADATIRHMRALPDRLRPMQLEHIRDTDIAIIPMLSRMQRVGMRINRPHFEEFSTYLGRELDEIREKLSSIVGKRTNPNSPRVAELLFRDMGLPAIKLTKGKTRESLDDDVLNVLKLHLRKRTDHISELAQVVIQCVQDYRERQKLKGTYVDTYLEIADRDDRVHTTFNYTKSVSRLSSEDPNLQNIPNPDNAPEAILHDPMLNFGLRMRNGFEARPGFKLISLDYSGIEMRVGAHESQDSNLLLCMREDKDPHKYAAEAMFNVPYDEVPKSLRTQAKPLNFGAFYDLSATGLQLQFATMPSGAIEKTVEECEQLLNWYFERFAPGVRAWKEVVRAKATADGYVRSSSGRIRWMPGLQSDIKKVRAAAERECTNFPIQDFAGYILRRAMAIIFEKTLPMLWSCGVDVECINTVHDELVLEAEEKYAEPVAMLVRDVMVSAVQISVPIKVGVGIGDTWGEIH